MSCQGGVSPWIAEVSSRFGVLTPAQARGYHPTKAWRRGDRDRNGSHAAC